MPCKSSSRRVTHPPGQGSCSHGAGRCTEPRSARPGAHPAVRAGGSLSTVGGPPGLPTCAPTGAAPTCAPEPPVPPIAPRTRAVSPSQPRPWRLFLKRKLTPGARERCSGRPARPHHTEQDGTSRGTAPRPPEPVAQASPPAHGTAAARLGGRAAPVLLCSDHPLVWLIDLNSKCRFLNVRYTQTAARPLRAPEPTGALARGRTRSPLPPERRALSPTRASKHPRCKRRPTQAASGSPRPSPFAPERSRRGAGGPARLQSRSRVAWAGTLVTTSQLPLKSSHDIPTST